MLKRLIAIDIGDFLRILVLDLTDRKGALELWVIYRQFSKIKDLQISPVKIFNNTRLKSKELKTHTCIICTYKYE